MHNYVDGYSHKKSKPGHPESGDRSDNKLPPIHGGNFDRETEKHMEDIKSGQNNILVTILSMSLNKFFPGCCENKALEQKGGRIQ